MISIIVPIYNSEQTLSSCINSTLYQTFQDFELVLINDGSTDGSENICLDYINKYNAKIKYFSKNNGGVSSARNLGLDKATGDYICFVDSDDYVESTYLEVLYNNLVEHHVDFSMCDVCETPNNGASHINLSDNNDIISAIISDRYSQKNRGPYCKLMKSKIIGDLRFNENIFLGEDTLFVIEYAKRCKNGVYIRQGLYHYETSTSSAAYRTDARLLKKYLTYIDSRRLMMKDTSMLNHHSYVLIANSLFQSIQDSYFIAKKANEFDVQHSLCSLMKELLDRYKLSFSEQDKPTTWNIMAKWPNYFDYWMYIYGKYQGLLFKLGLQK